MPIGVVFIQAPGMDDDQMRHHFRTMRELGFNCLKGLYVLPGEDLARIERMALEEGIIPWWFGEAGFEPVTDGLLERLGIAPGTPLNEVREHPAYRTHQERLMRERIDRRARGVEIPHDGRPRFPFSFDAEITHESSSHFAQWLKRTYKSVAALADAWNMGRTLIKRPEPMWQSWDDVERSVIDLLQSEKTEYRRLRDVLRYKADVYLEMVQEKAQKHRETEPFAPTRAGGEMGLFLPFASRATDMEGVADAMADSGSFYPSIHLAWHFEEVGFEVVRPIYMQASLAADWFKGGWSATWESTGGPQQLSGGKASLFEEMAPHTAGFTVDGGTMTQLLLSYLAAGFKGVGLWCWNGRNAGWEAGEYALCDRQDRPSDRAVAAGRIGRAMQRWRDEIWAAHKEPLVGIYTDWDNDAMWAAIAIGGRTKFKHAPTQARIGCARALINGNVPWEHVSATDLRAGLADRYRTIYLPAILSISESMLELLHGYAERGGRVVLDLPGAWYDDFGRLLKTGTGSAFERLFGCTIRDMQYSSVHRGHSIEGRAVEGFVADLEPTRAQVLAHYDAKGPAITEHRLGRGTAVVIGCEASTHCLKPDNTSAEQFLRTHALGDTPTPFACDGAIVYRLASSPADHFVLINDGEAKQVRLSVRAPYRDWRDAVTDEPVAVESIRLEAHSGRWLRAIK